jgi:hypothetical protein
MTWVRSLSFLFCWAVSTSAAAEEFELDLSPTANVTGVLVLPPVATVVVGKKAAFVGVETRKTVERFDFEAHQKLVQALDTKLGGKVVPAEVAAALLKNSGIGPVQLSRAGVVAQLAKAANVEWVVVSTLTLRRVLTSSLIDLDEKKRGEAFVSVSDLAVSDTEAQTLAAGLIPVLVEAQKPVAAAAEAPPAAPAADVAEAKPDADLADAELEITKAHDAAKAWAPHRNRMRAMVAVGPGAAFRELSLAGDAAPGLAELSNTGVAGLGVSAQVMPFELLESTAGTTFSQFSLELHYRRAFVKAQGVSGGVEGQPCSMTDDDLQLRAGWRYTFGPRLPTVGLAAGWSQEQTLFECQLPLLSTTWRGVDAQLRVRQPLGSDLVTLELVGGPRFLLAGPLASSPGFSLAGEAWVEVKPVSVLFIRGGARLSRLQATNATISALDSRAFVALELGAFL